MNNATLVALYVLASDYHSGQASRGYRVLCHAYRLLVKRGISRIDIRQWRDAQESPEYRRYQPLAERYF